MSDRATAISDRALQQQRLNEILRRHVLAEDATKSDMEFVKAVIQRANVQWGWALVDPAE